MRWCSGLSLVPIKVKILQGPGSNPGPNHGGLFFGLFMGFLDFLLAPFNNLWYYIIVQWSKTHPKCVIVLIAWSWQNHDHCAQERLRAIFEKAKLPWKWKLCRTSRIHTYKFGATLVYMNLMTYLSNLDILIKMTLPVLISVPPSIVPWLAKYFGPPKTVCFANSRAWLVTEFRTLFNKLTAMLLAVN